MSQDCGKSSYLRVGCRILEKNCFTVAVMIMTKQNNINNLTSETAGEVNLIILPYYT